MGNEQMKVDLQILAHHRLEAGAPDPVPLTEVVMPNLPAWAWQTAPAPKAAAPGMALWGAAGVRPTMASLQASMAVKAAAAAGGGAELRLMALFVAKWKLDPNRTKASLAKLEPSQRRFIIQNFKAVSTGGTAAVTDELEKHITEAKEKENWPKSEGIATNGAAVTPVAAGVKRPAEAAATQEPAKVMTAAAMRAKILATQQAGAAIRPPTAMGAGPRMPGLVAK